MADEQPLVPRPNRTKQRLLRVLQIGGDCMERFTFRCVAHHLDQRLVVEPKSRWERHRGPAEQIDLGAINDRPEFMIERIPRLPPRKGLQLVAACC